jgi:hypothetical protein
LFSILTQKDFYVFIASSSSFFDSDVLAVDLVLRDFEIFPSSLVKNRERERERDRDRDSEVV